MVISQKWFIKITFVIDNHFRKEIIALVDSGADMNVIQEGIIPTRYFHKTTNSLSHAGGEKLDIKFKIPLAYICKDKVCIPTSFLLVINIIFSEKNISIKFNYWDYISAFDKVLYYQNNKKKHTWFIKICGEVYKSPIPNWFVNWWSYHGPSYEILPEKWKTLYSEWIDLSPQISKLITSHHSGPRYSHNIRLRIRLEEVL